MHSPFVAFERSKLKEKLFHFVNRLRWHRTRSVLCDSRPVRGVVCPDAFYRENQLCLPPFQYKERKALFNQIDSSSFWDMHSPPRRPRCICGGIDIYSGRKPTCERLKWFLAGQCERKAKHISRGRSAMLHLFLTLKATFSVNEPS